MAETAGRLKVRLYTSAHIVDGYIGVLPKQRLLDILNGVLRGALRTGEEFLQVNEAKLCSADGTKVTLQSAYINRASILFAREIEDGQTRGLGSEVGHKPYPFVSKSAAAVRLYMPLYTLTGQMHCAKGQRLPDVLNTRERFLALTNVQIVPSGGSSESVSFVAVNKEQIISLEEGGIRGGKIYNSPMR
jgi:hypothetical protein